MLGQHVNHCQAFLVGASVYPPSFFFFLVLELSVTRELCSRLHSFGQRMSKLFSVSAVEISGKKW